MVKHLEENEDLLEVIGNDFFLVDFYANWCGPCKMLAPILEEIDFIKVLKIDTDKFPTLAAQYGIMSIPTLLFFKDKKEVKRVIGFKNKEEIKDIVDSLA